MPTDASPGLAAVAEFDAAVRQEPVLGMGLSFLNALPDGQPDTRMLHAGLPPVRGEKWIVSQFIRSRPVRG